jgi:hypothetical protein
MRAALTRVRDQDGLNLRITPEQIAISSARNAAVEDKVKLPVRWLRGFAEVQALAATLQPVMTLSAPAARRFLAAIPAEVRASDQVWLLPAGNGVRISRQRSKTGAAAAGLGRLKPMVPLARYADRLRIYAGANGVSAFELDFGVARFTLMLSAAAARGFSGEGQLLSRLTRSDRDGALARVRAQLSWQSRLVASEMAVSMGLTETQVTSALSLLATQGLVGFDAHEHCFFHRELPFDRSHIEDLHPRLKDARALLAEGAVTIDGARASVRSGAVTHRVKADSEAFHCTCRWHARTGGESGPCKHVLAAMLAMDENPA